MRKDILILAVGWCLMSGSVDAQPPAPSRSPKETVELFNRMDSEGARLTTEGWFKSAGFFLKPSPPPKKMTMMVITGVNQIAYSSTTEGDRAEVWTEYTALGRLDSSGRFTRKVGQVGGSSKYPVYGPEKFREPYKLKLSTEHWELTPTPDGTPKPANGPLEWRIDPFHPEPRITIETAILLCDSAA